MSHLLTYLKDKRIIKQLVTLIFLLLSSTTLYSQSDYEFWFAAPPVTHQFVPPSPILYQNLNQPIRLYFTTAEGPATVTISQPANPSFTPIVVIVNNPIATGVDLTSFIDNVETKPANSVLNWGLHITSNKRITAYYEVQSPHNAETWPLLGRNSLGYEFIIPSQQHYSNYAYSSPPALNSFEVVATEDTTTVKILPKVGIVGHAALDTAIIVLNQGQSWNGSALSGDSTAHLAGSFVFSDKPVAVTVSDDAIHVPAASNNSEDIAGAQLMPRHLSGTEFAFSGSGNGLGYLNKIYIYAYENSTSIIFNDSNRIISRTINRGDSMEIRQIVSNGIGGLFHIQSDKPILVMLYSFPDEIYPFGFSSPQASSVIVPPITCGGSKRVVSTSTPPSGKNPEFDFNIITNKANIPYFTTNPSGILDTNNYQVIPGTFGNLVIFPTVAFDSWPLSTTFEITNSKGRFQFHLSKDCAATDTADYAKNGFFSDYSTLYLGSDKKMCPGDSLLLDAGYGWDSYLWSTGDTTSTIWVKSPGTYWVSTTQEGGCNLSDTINISYYFFTPVNLGPNREICNGDSTLLDAGAGRSWYDWSTGDSTQSIFVKTSGTYWVKVPDIHCTVSDTIIVTTTPVPSVTNNPLSKSICSGDSTDIVLTSSVAGTMFHWTASLTSGNITGFSADSGLILNQILIDNLPTPGVITYHITPKVGSCAGATVDFPVTVTPGDSVKVSITPSTNNVCAGTQVTFTATPTNPGTTPIYQWKVNGINAGTNSTTFTYTPVNGDVVTCVLISSLTACISNNPATSNGITMVVNPNHPVSVSVAASQNPVCAGNSVTFTATPTNGGVSPIYQWKVNSIGVGINSPNYSYIPTNGDIVTCILTSNAICPTGNPATSSAITMTVNPDLAVSITISASANPFCQGSSVTFTGTPVNGGVTPSFQWQVNGVNVGINSPNYSYSPTNGDVVICDLNSSIACPIGNPASSNSITMIVNSNLPADVTIAASSNPFCPGSSVTFTATPVNGGSTPSYQWKVNGVNAGTNSHTFTYNPVDGDSVRCVMTSNLSCVTGNPASSADIIMSGTLAPIVTFTSCFDTITTINAKPIKLKGGIPLGGIYSGPGVNSLTGVFTPSVAGTGTKIITYSYTNVVLCTASKSIHIIVQAAPMFICGNNLTDIRDSKVYQTVQIGSQCWLASNLNFGTILASSQDQRDNCVSEKYCYNDNPTNCTSFGGLYQWDELMLYDNTPADQGFCPPAWHIPTENDWNTLFATYINNGFAGSPLKYSGFSGFNALLSGMRHINKSWDFQGFATFFWSSTSYGGYKAWAHGINDPDPSVSIYPSSRANAFSVRCVHD
jgi:uncharacterized protein (TIGR02145 family)